MKKENILNNSTLVRPTDKFAGCIGTLTDAKISVVFLERQEGGRQPVSWNMNPNAVVQIAGAANQKPALACCGKCSKKNEEMLEHCNSQRRNNRRTAANIESILHESRISGLVILDAGMSFDAHDNRIVSDAIKTVLKKTACPVIIARSTFSAPGEIVFVYDGSAAAVFAIKQFIYLFPRMNDKQITVLQVNTPENTTIAGIDNIHGLLQIHYSSIAFHPLKASTGGTILAYLASKTNAIGVMSASACSLVLDSCLAGTAEPLLNTINTPLFIAQAL